MKKYNVIELLNRTPNEYAKHLAEGYYQVKVINAYYKNDVHGKKILVIFEILNGDYEKLNIWLYTDVNTSNGNYTLKFVELADATLKLDELTPEIDTKKIIGKTCWVEIRHYRNLPHWYKTPYPYFVDHIYPLISTLPGEV